jgi:hypothetical protein
VIVLRVQNKDGNTNRKDWNRGIYICPVVFTQSMDCSRLEWIQNSSTEAVPWIIIAVPDYETAIIHLAGSFTRIRVMVGESKILDMLNNINYRCVKYAFARCEETE